MPSEKKIDYIAEAIDEAFGQRCLEYAEGCACCEAWAQYDALTAAEQAEPAPAARSSEPEFEVAPDNGTPAEVLSYVLDCARRWSVDARIIGNARAGDIERAISACLNFAPAARSGAVKVKVGEIMEAAWPEFGGNHQTAEFWQDFNEGVTFALKYLAALEPAETATDAEPVALGEDIGGKVVSVRMDKSRHCTVPLYTHPPERRLREALEQIANNTCCDGCQEAALVARAALAQGSEKSF